MRTALLLLICCTCVKSPPRMGTPEKGTKHECKGKKIIVDDPKKCDKE